MTRKLLSNVIHMWVLAANADPVEAYHACAHRILLVSHRQGALLVPAVKFNITINLQLIEKEKTDAILWLNQKS